MFQTTLSTYIKINGVHPDLTLILVIGWVILRDLEEGLGWALIGGVSLDILSPIFMPFGVFTLTMLLVTLVANLSHGLMFGSSIVMPLSLTFPLSLLFNGLILSFLALFGQPVIWAEAVTFILLPAAIFNTAVMLVIFPLLYLLNGWLNPQPLSL